MGIIQSQSGQIAKLGNQVPKNTTLPPHTQVPQTKVVNTNATATANISSSAYTSATGASVANSTTNTAAPGTTTPVKVPQKYIPFGRKDSNAIEAAYLRLAEDEVAVEAAKLAADSFGADTEGDMGLRSEIHQEKRRKLGEDLLTSASEDDKYKIPVNEDYLFDVDLKKRELAPVYWRGPSYDIRRGTWFFQGRGCTLSPLFEKEN